MQNQHPLIIITGATGTIGQLLIPLLQKNQYTIAIITQDTKRAKDLYPSSITILSWSDTQTLHTMINHAYAVINLAGAPLQTKRWTQTYKHILITSRVHTTQKLVNLIQKASHKPRVFISMSALGYYQGTQTSVATEQTKPGNTFLAQLCVSWEQEAKKIPDKQTRLVLVRSGIVLNKGKGVLSLLMIPFRLFLGSSLGNKKDFFTWIHSEDLVHIILFSLKNSQVTGPINAVAPQKTTNDDLARTLGNVLHRPYLFHIPSFLLQLFFGEKITALSQKNACSSEKIQEKGYIFFYPTLKSALTQLLEKKEREYV